MQLVKGSERIVPGEVADPIAGRVVWAPVKSLWIAAMTAAAAILGPITFSWAAFAVFLLVTGITLCFGHSLGMHRRLIHRSYDCPMWLERVFVYLGTLVGMAGPVGMTRVHDYRDWAQRQVGCHDYFGHRRSFWVDYWWQLHCDLVLDNPPAFLPEKHLARDRFYVFLERYWMWQQLPLALLLFALGGWGFVVWGVCVRVAVSVTGHWLVGHFAHRQGRQTWTVRGAAVQGYNVPIAGLISMGESWHGNHHAFPGSARLGLLPGQPDPGWWVLCGLAHIGLVWDIKTPTSLPWRSELAVVRVPDDVNTNCAQASCQR